MSKYIDSEKLILEIRNVSDTVGDDPVYEAGYGAACLRILLLIRSLQKEQPDDEEIDKVAQELYEHLYELKRRNNVPENLYDKQEIIHLWKAGVEYGRNHPKQEQPKSGQTCKTCGFYENNCPFIRGKLIPYPNKVCNDYIHSTMKEQEQAEVDIEKEMEKYFGENWKDGTPIKVQDDMIKFARHFWNKGYNARKEE